MSGFFEEFMGSYNPFDSAGYDEQVIMRNSLFAVVPKIAKNELTQMQRICFEMFYFEKKNQKLLISTRQGTKILSDLLNQCEEANVSMTSIAIRAPSLEDVFISLTGRNLGADTGQEHPKSGRKTR